MSATSKQVAANGSLPAFCRPVYLDRVSSTNDEARRLAADGAPEYTLIVAREQSAGRGRRGRSWISPPGNLYCSMVLRPTSAPGPAAQLGFAAALALGDAIRGLGGRNTPVAYKWPNDVLLDGAKVAGILPETSGSSESVDWLVIGLGVNVLSAPGETSYAATSIKDWGLTQVGVEALLAAFVGGLAEWYERWQDEGFGPLRAAWKSHAHGLNSPIQVKLSENQVLSGRFVDLDLDGALVLDQGIEPYRRIHAGEIFSLGS